MLPLSVPDDTDITDSAAVQLLLARATEIDAKFELKERRDLEALGAVVRRLEGLPLALELAAAPLVDLGPQRLRQEIDHGGAIPHGGDTLAAAVAWSWALLEKRDRDALAACSIFQGGFDLRAAEAVLELEAGDAVGVLQSLFDKSLVHTPTHGRFAMYRSIRDFALTKLEDSSRVRRLHAEYFASLGAAQLTPSSTEAAFESWQVLRKERDNIGLAADHENLDLAAKALNALARLFRSEGASERDESRLDRAVDASGIHQVRILNHRALLHLMQSRDASSADVERAVDVARTIG